MANVNLKTDFKDGEFLYADQLKNNFEAIQAALNAMNAIVWQDNADKVVTFRGTTEELMNREIIDGQILYDTTTGESYIDYKGKRISTGSGNAIHIGDTEPTNPSTQIWIDKDELSAVGSEVVNSLEGNEERMAPSVAAVKHFINGTILYEDENGQNDNIVLTDNIFNYKEIKIDWLVAIGDYVSTNSIKVPIEVGQSVLLNTMIAHSDSLQIFNISRYLVNDTSITKQIETGSRILNSSAIEWNGNTTRTMITKVMAYK